MKGHVGDKVDDLWIRLFGDADFAGEKNAKSTSGIFECLYGPNTMFPLHAMSKKQGSVAHCTPEAEIVAANIAVRCVGIPAISLWSVLLKRKIHVEFMEDNTATAIIINTGKNPNLRHVNRTQKVSIAWLHERFKHDNLLSITICPTKEMRADIFTKRFINFPEWLHATSLIGIDVSSIKVIKGQGGDAYTKRKSTPKSEGINEENYNPNVKRVRHAYLCNPCNDVKDAVYRISNKCCQWCCIDNIQYDDQFITMMSPLITNPCRQISARESPVDSGLLTSSTQSLTSALLAFL